MYVRLRISACVENSFNFVKLIKPSSQYDTGSISILSIASVTAFSRSNTIVLYKNSVL